MAEFGSCQRLQKPAPEHTHTHIHTHTHTHIHESVCVGSSTAPVFRVLSADCQIYTHLRISSNFAKAHKIPQTCWLVTRH
ncbi:uncharacterized protein BO88DRAFT_249493 [Aspergillus vadensis CBS 113365]|uniref:Uncharacterized protein n=1 Tax=Aspergillus vadensis (strain CBS 113365 / IMI 142717 / IBT 24658) TaxID=1448311 RepID=A0A319C7M5_ASPVC|nr:hypothetical protein BO88DRAFT_249493 [Aspergillus vadensis CBS 113365]PYH71348.1 hypothetical protein BO88DRAFT_249493 [Aspergillus vadensis CBS 113365]